MQKRDRTRHCRECDIVVTGNWHRHINCKRHQRLANDHQAAVSEASRGNYSNLIGFEGNNETHV